MKLCVNAVFSALKETFPSALLLGKTKQDNDLSLSPPFFTEVPSRSASTRSMF